MAVVAKYGGTSIAAVEQAIKVINANPSQRVIVVSAPGKIKPRDVKTTDLLERYAKNRNKTALNKILARFKSIGAEEELLVDIERIISGSHERKFIISRGEYFTARILASRLGCDYIDAAKVFKFNRQGQFDPRRSRKAIEKQLANLKQRVIVPGFYGASDDGKIQLFRRGGSDRTGALLASYLNIDYQNWTDVDGIYSAHPKIVGKKAVIIPKITIEEVREGANGGSSVLMGDTIFDLHQSEVKTRVMNTFNPKSPGTMVLHKREKDLSFPIIGVAGHDDLLKLEIRKFGMNKIPGYIHRLLAYFSAESISEDERISIEYLPMGIDGLSVAVRSRHLTKERKKRLEELPKKIGKDEILKPDNMLSWRKSAVVYLVSQELLNKKIRTSVHHRATRAFIKNGLYFEDDVSDSSSPSIAFLVDRPTMKPAIKSLHKEFFEK